MATPFPTDDARTGAPRPPVFHAGSATRPATPEDHRAAGDVGPEASPASLMADPLAGMPRPEAPSEPDALFDSQRADALDRKRAARRQRLLGLPIWTAGRAKLFQHLVGRIAELDSRPGRPVELHSVNAEISIQVRGDERYRELLANNPINLPDGEWVRRLVHLKHGSRPERISGSDMVVELCALAADQDWPVFLLGAQEEVSERATAVLRERHPELELARYSPPHEPGPTLSPETTAEVLERIAAARPTVLMAFLGSPKQELWTRRHEQELAAAGVRVVLGAGAGLDFVAGAVRRAPAWVSAAGFEWLWRLARQPKARFGRAVRRLPAFLALGLVDAVAGCLSRLLGRTPTDVHIPPTDARS